MPLVKCVGLVKALALSAGLYQPGSEIGAPIPFPNRTGVLCDLELKGAAPFDQFQVYLFDSRPIGSFHDHKSPSLDQSRAQSLVDIYAVRANALGVAKLQGVNVAVLSGLWAVVTAKSMIVPGAQTSLKLSFAND